MAEINIMLFIAGFFRCMRGKYQSFLYFFNIVLDTYYINKMQQIIHVLHSDDIVQD